ncbi:large ribosomal subunit protein eL30-like [Neofelis nebulosa]|uniref:large ribosomal subunit protein eL30-like n=1 Tax=Neofelis nebulosa TaxID=61452 RepID=UPI00272D3FC6|nr:large ribosomal subunit protein eL30-like [Neofelis nebulosa]
MGKFLETKGVLAAAWEYSLLKVPIPSRKIVAAKKMKKSLELVNSSFQLVMTSGKYMLGYKQTLKIIRYGKVKLVVLANNCPALRKSEIEYCGMLAKTGAHYYSGNNINLSTAWKKYYRVSTLTSIDPGDSDVIRSMPEQIGEK